MYRLLLTDSYHYLLPVDGSAESNHNVMQIGTAQRISASVDAIHKVAKGRWKDCRTYNANKATTTTAVDSHHDTSQTQESDQSRFSAIADNAKTVQTESGHRPQNQKINTFGSVVVVGGRWFTRITH